VEIRRSKVPKEHKKAGASLEGAAGNEGSAKTEQREAGVNESSARGSARRTGKCSRRAEASQ